MYTLQYDTVQYSYKNMIVEELITAKTEPEIDFIKPEIDFKDNYITCNGCGYGIHEEFILKVKFIYSDNQNTLK